MFFAFLLAYLIVPFLIVGLLSLLPVPFSDAFRLFLAQLATTVSWIAIFAGLARHYHVDMLAFLGLRPQGKIVQLIGIGVLGSVFILLLGGVLGFMAQKFNWPIMDPYSRLNTDQLKWVTLMAVSLAPILEEISFRGLLQTTLYRYLHPMLAILTATLIFALFHSLYFGNWLALAYVFSLGLFLGCVRYFTGSTIPCIVSHMLNNLLAAMAIFAQ